MASGISTPAESHNSPHDNALVYNPIHPNHSIIQFNSDGNDFNNTDLDCTLIHTTFFESDQASLLLITFIRYPILLIYWH